MYTQEIINKTMLLKRNQYSRKEISKILKLNLSQINYILQNYKEELPYFSSQIYSQRIRDLACIDKLFNNETYQTICNKYNIKSPKSIQDWLIPYRECAINKENSMEKFMAKKSDIDLKLENEKLLKKIQKLEKENEAIKKQHASDPIFNTLLEILLDKSNK